MDEKKILSDEELGNVSGGRLVPSEENCGKWWKCISSGDCFNAGNYAYITATSGGTYYAKVYTVDGDSAHAVSLLISPNNLFIHFTEIDVNELPEAVSKIAGC